MGGILTLGSFVETFPEMDTVNTTGARQTENANIQGAYLYLTYLSYRVNVIDHELTR